MEEFRHLNWEIRRCKRCGLWKTRTHALPGEGNISSKLIMIAQAPGYNEDREGRMFIGPSGMKFNKLLIDASIPRREIFITNVLRCKLPGNRKPKVREIKACKPYLNREIDLIDPPIIATLGFYATSYIFERYGMGDELEFPKVCGRVFTVKGKKILPLQHPAATLYNPQIYREMADNYRNLRNLLDAV
jgi:uracil-DNA glycosylase family 4